MRMLLPPLLAMAGLAALVAGCGDNGTAPAPDSQVTDFGQDSLFGIGDEGADAVADQVAPPDTDAGETPLPDTGSETSDGGGTPGCASKPPWPTGCSCAGNDECDVGLCIDTHQGGKCAKLASQGCANDEKKVSVGSGVDVIEVCVPKFPKVCNPCSNNGACQSAGYNDAACVDLGDNGAFCGVACKSVDDCPQGYVCSAGKDVAGNPVQQCVVAAGAACACSPYAIQQQYATKCFVAASEGKCQGARTCLPAGAQGAPEGGGLSACLAPEPLKEVCNGKDDDCDGQTDEATCNDNNPCTDDACLGAGGCKNTANTLTCDADGSACTKGDACLEGVCYAGKALLCDDFNNCTSDTCDKEKGCVFTNADGTGCNADDTDCTVADQCKAGKCEAGPKKACDLGDPCVAGTCQVATGKCNYVIKDGAPCDDGNPCTSQENCKGEICLGGVTDCNDNNPCTGDQCDAKVGCVHSALQGLCDDGDPCTLGDACAEGKCLGSLQKGIAKCDDGNPCTADTCDASGGNAGKPTGSGCQNKAVDGGVCDDGNPCTQGDKCAGGKCTASQNICMCTGDADCKSKEDNDLCNGTLYCDKSGPAFKCVIVPGSVVKCGDGGNTCAVTACEPATGKCKSVAKANGAACEADGDVCTNDQCNGGLCAAGMKETCDDLNPCTQDACDAKAGCTHQALTGACDADGDACTQGDTCKGGTCVKGTAKVCDDGEACTQDGCDAMAGTCTFAPLQQSCSDGDACTTGDACGLDGKGKYTCVPGKGSKCDDANPCTVDACDVQKGCTYQTAAAGEAVACWSGDPKFVGVGACKAGKAICGADGKPGQCIGEVPPKATDPCNGVDDDCDGVADPGCGPASFTVRQAAGAYAGQGKSYSLRASVGASRAAGLVEGTGKYSARLGFVAWLKALVK
jgi:hypothetical protein